jgi:hypothetical protein
MLWLIPIAAFFVYCLYLGRNTVRSCENAALAQVNEAQIDAALAQVRTRNTDVPVPSQQNTETPEEVLTPEEAAEEAAYYRGIGEVISVAAESGIPAHHINFRRWQPRKPPSIWTKIRLAMLREI